MNVFNRIALQGLKGNRTRTLVTVIGVALSAALITAVATFAVSLQSYMMEGAAAKYGGWHIQIPDADSALAAQQAQDSRVAGTAALQNLGYATLEGGQNPDKPYLFVSGWDESAFAALPLTLLSGRLPKNSSEILVPAHVAANGGVKIALGDSLSLSLGNRVQDGVTLNQHDAYRAGQETLMSAAQRTYTVVGICQRLATEEYAAPGYTLITAADTAAADSLTVFVTLNNPYQINAYTNSISSGHSFALNDDVLRFMGLSGETLLTVLLYSIGGILVALVMLGSIFLIYNSFHISLNERTHQFGILMSTGATQRQLRHCVLFEGLCIGAIGIPLGVLMGIPGIQLVLSLVASNFANVLYDNVPLSLVVSMPALAAAAVISGVTILISAYLPAKKAARTPVMECIRQTNEIKVEAKALKISRLAKRFYGLEEMLALKNFKRNKQRYRSIILSLTLSVVLFVSASSFGIYLNQVAQRSAVVVEDYDICFFSREISENELFALYDRLKAVGGVKQSSYQALSTYACTLNTSDVSSHFFSAYGAAIGYDGASQTVEVQMDMQFVPDDVYRTFVESLGLSAKQYSGQDGNLLMAGFLPDAWYTQEQPMEFTLPSAADSPAKTIRATFVKDYPDLLPADAGESAGYTLMAIVPYTAKPQFDALSATVTPTKLGMTFQSEQPGQSTKEMQAILDSASITANYELYNLYAMLEPNRNIIFIVNLFSIVFIAMISLIAIANVFNTISTNIKLRRRELAMLRSVGMCDTAFNKMMCFECVLYGARTMLWALPLSCILSCLIYLGMVSGGGEIAFSFPWASLAISILGVFLVVFITILYATGKIKKENILDALRDDIA